MVANLVNGCRAHTMCGARKPYPDAFLNGSNHKHRSLAFVSPHHTPKRQTPTSKQQHHHEHIPPTTPIATTH
eukprot:14009197-Alexandrium_andersonii.AAC.1